MAKLGGSYLKYSLGRKKERALEEIQINRFELFQYFCFQNIPELIIKNKQDTFKQN